MGRAVAAAVLVCMLSGCASGPGGAGQREITSKGIDRASEYSAQHGEAALVIWQDRDRYERFARGMTRSRHHHVRSISKPVWAIAIFRAADEGLVNIHEPVSKTLTSWQSDRQKRTITPLQLLQMTAGVDYGPGLYSGRRGVRERSLAAPLRASPGSTFIYSGASWEVLGAWFEQSLQKHGLTAESYLASRILNPLGGARAEFRRDAKGDPYFSAGMSLSARDLFALGRHILRRAPVRTGSSINPAFHAGFWFNRAGAGREVFVEDWVGRGGNWHDMRISSHAPTDLIVLLGSSGQRVYISQSMHLVIVRLGQGGGFRDAEFWRHLSTR